MTLPFSDPVLIVATATLIFVAVPLLAERARVPGMVGLILAGAVLGPNGFGVLARNDTVVLLGTVGLLYLMLLVGLELDLEQFARYRVRSIVFGLLTFAVPALLGAAIALALGYRLASALLVASAFATHTLLTFPIASRLGIVRNPAVVAALGGTILAEVLALLLLAVVARGGASAAASPRFWLALAVPFVLYVAGVFGLLPRLARWFFRREEGGAADYIFVLAVLFSVSYLAHYGSVEPIVGALLVGLVLNPLIPEHGVLANRIHFVGNAIFIPFFLLSVGMLVDVRALRSPPALGFAAALTLGVIVTKWLAAWLAGQAFRWTADEGWVVFGLSVPHAAGTLAIVLVGYDLRLLDQAEVNGVVLMILVTCVVGPWATERFGRRVAAHEAAGPRTTGAPPRRVLVPLAKPSSAPALLDLALAIRGGDTAEPLYPLVVVDDDDTGERVAEAEGVLAGAVSHVSGAAVPVAPLTRMDNSRAAGIARAAAETRAWAVVLGWEGRAMGARALLGALPERMLERTRQLVLVARLQAPPSTLRRVTVVVPPGAERHPGLSEAAVVLRRLAAGIGAELSGVALEGDGEMMARRFGGGAAGWRSVGWDALDELRHGPGDELLVLLAPRPGAPAWSPRTARLPALLVPAGTASFVVLYLAEDGPHAPAELPGGVLPDRVVRLGRTPYDEAVRRMLHSILPPDDVAALAPVVVRNEEQFSSELLPGVVLPHVRLAGLDRPRLVLGTSNDGVRFPRASAPAHLVFLLVSPAERAEEHLNALASVARAVGSPEQAAALVERFAPGTSLDWMHVDD